MNKKNYLFIALAALAITACSNDDEPGVNNGPVEAKISAGVDVPLTRAIDDRWEADEIGVMATEVSGTSQGVTSVMTDMYKNVKYITSASTNAAANFTAANGGIFFQDANETVTFAAYGPYQTSAANELPGTDGVISDKATTNQNTRELQKAFDFIHASGATASKGEATVNFSGGNAFSHKMARLIIIVRPGKDVSNTDITSGTYTLGGLKHSGTFNVETGEAEATGDVTNGWSLSEKSLKTDGETTQVTFTSILYPQTLASALSFTASVNGQTYTNTKDINPSLAAGMSYTYTIDVDKKELTVSGCTINNWGSGTGGGGTAEM